MSEERVTIRQLARLSGVSIGTVSRALNGYADVSPETRARVKALKQLGMMLRYTVGAGAYHSADEEGTERCPFR